MAMNLCRGFSRLSFGAAVPTFKSSISRLSSSIVLPQNVVMEEGPKVFTKEPVMDINPIEMLFPPLKVDKSIKIHKFHCPGEFMNTEANLNPAVFGVAIRHDIVHEVVRYQRALFRQPNKTKRSFEISGSTKKPYAQKGGGRAQAGNKRASHWRGGQKAHGPHLRSYAIGMNKKSRALGLMITLAAKHREGNLMVFDTFNVESHRTKDFFEILKSHGLHETKLIMIDEVIPENLGLACGNLKSVCPLLQAKTNVYDILKREKLLITSESLERLQNRLVGQYTHQGALKSHLSGLNDMKNHPGFALLNNGISAD